MPGEIYVFDKARQWTTNVMYATIGVGLVYLAVKRQKNVLQFFQQVKCQPLGSYKVLVVDTPEECQRVMVLLKRKCRLYPVLGFDCEWISKNGRRCPVALLQLATESGICALIRLFKFEFIPSSLKELMEDPNILKVGVSPDEDARHLFHDYGLKVCSFVDLRHLVVKNGGSPKGGLGGLSENILGVVLDKNWRLRCSNWEAEELSDKQRTYAALDALVGIKLFKVLNNGYLKYPGFTYLWLKNLVFGGVFGTERTVRSCEDCIDVKFSGSRNNRSGSKGESVGLKTKPIKPASRAYCTRQTPLYHNCYLLAPDGAVLCTCDPKKAKWYVSKDLADLISEDPLTVKLKFEPAGRAIGKSGEYYTQEKSNCCVVCGKIDTGLRKIIVPHEYRKYFPRVLKEHASHDVLIMCLMCHQKSNMHDISMRHKLAEECSAPISSHENAKCFEDRKMKSVQMAAKALLAQPEKLPDDRKKILRQIILDYYRVSDLSQDVLKQAMNLQTSIPNKDYEPHGLKVVKYYSTEGIAGLIQLEETWRKHFLHTMKPKHLPKLWSVTHTQDRLRVHASKNSMLADELTVAGLKECVNMLEDTDEGNLTNKER